jgi:Protein of unknown function (DUF2934)
MARSESVETCEIDSSTSHHCPTPDEIGVRAHEIFLERGATPGHDLDDWLQAEEELVKKRANVVSAQKQSIRQ